MSLNRINKNKPDLPINTIVPKLLGTIGENDCIISAPPGAGKSSYLPLALLELDCFANKQILLLQPRQVAVRSIANFLALSLGEKVGQTVGYQMRGESAISANTRLCVITEGLLISKLQNDPMLSDVGLIIFDEFHERSLASDISLGLSLEVQGGLRDDLRILVMSATLNMQALSHLMPKATQLKCEGRSFPIKYHYKPVPSAAVKGGFSNPQLQLINTIVDTLNTAYEHDEGNILVFLPGAAIINKVKNATERLPLANTLIAPLYGALSPAQQKKALDAPPPGQRKIVLATNIAETSLTIDGVNIVIDSGREKVQRFVVPRKLNQLSEQMISKASSIQRAGRAGRQQAGKCYRLWSQEQQQFLQENAPAQITQVDISQMLLTLYEWGSDFEQLPLIDKPSAAQIDYGVEYLRQLDFINDDKQITTHGKQASQFNTHPSLAKLLLLAKQHSNDEVKVLSSLVVALIEGKSLSSEANSIDIVVQCRYVVELLCANKQTQISTQLAKDLNRITKQLGIKNNPTVILNALKNREDLAVLIGDILLPAFPDKVALKRNNTGYVLSNGTGAEFLQDDESLMPQWIICTQTQLSHKTSAVIRQYCELLPATVDAYLQKMAQSSTKQSWDESLAKVVCKQLKHIGAIEVSSQACSFEPDENTSELIKAQIKKKGLYPLLGKANTLLARMALAKQIDAEFLQDFPDVSENSLLESADTWLVPFLHKITTWQQLTKLDWANIVASTLNYQQQRYLNDYFPTHFTAPTGNKHKLDYSQSGKVTLAIRVQELYGLNEQVTVGKNKLPLTLSLLSPGHKEIQKTADLPMFWIGSYFAVQKEMKGRYPKHYWPDNPASATATTKTKKRMGEG